MSKTYSGLCIGGPWSTQRMVQERSIVAMMIPVLEPRSPGEDAVLQYKTGHYKHSTTGDGLWIWHGPPRETFSAVLRASELVDKGRGQ